MAEEATKPKSAKRARRQEQRAERLAILDAARRVLQKTGTQDLSLDEVASEAAVDIEAVTRHFQSKNELLLSLAADALTSMARVARNDIVTDGASEQANPTLASDGALSLLRMAETIVSPASEPAEYGPPVGEVQGPPQRRASDRQRRTSDALRRASDRQRRGSDGDRRGGEAESREPERPSIRKKNLRRAADLHAVLNNLEQPEAQPRAAEPSPRIERKLQVLEHAVSELVEHNSKSEHGNNVELNLLQESVKSLGERIDVFERQYRDSVAHLRSLVAETAIRSLASGAQDAAADATAGMAPGDAPISAYEESGANGEPLLLDTPSQASEPASNESATTGNTLAQSYLLAARQAANQSLEDANKPRKKSPKRVQESDLKLEDATDRSTLLRYALIGGVTLMLLAFAGRVAFDRGVADATPPATPSAPNAHAALVQPKASSEVKPQTPTGTAVKSQNIANAASKDSLAKLAEGGNAGAQLLLGVDFLDGDGLKQDDVQAAHWLQLSAAKGNAVAQYWLATLYAHGKGIAADNAQAVHWYELSAKQGNVKAMNSLARAYATGTGTKQDMTEAADWFGQGAVLGFTTSQFNLAVLYEHGTGVPQSRLDAYMWYAVAAAQGDAESKLHIEALKAELTDEERTAAEGAAKAFKPAALNAAANDLPDAAKLKQ